MIKKNKNLFLNSASNQMSALAKSLGFLSLSLFALLFISGCPETITETITVMGPTVTNTVTNNVTNTVTNTPPMLVSNQRVAFTYSNNASFLLANKGGRVENCHLFTNGVDAINVLPMGLTVTASNGLCVVEGMSTRLTLTANFQEITNVPVVLVASNAHGFIRVPVEVVVEPRYVAGNFSSGLLYFGFSITPQTGANYRESQSEESIEFHDGSHLIHKVTALPFASGGTGAPDDPVIIGIDQDAKEISFVMDCDNVAIPDRDTFYIRFLYKKVISTRSLGVTLMSNIGMTNIFGIEVPSLLTGEAPLYSGGFDINDDRGETRLTSVTIRSNAARGLNLNNRVGGMTVNPTLRGIVRVRFEFSAR